MLVNDDALEFEGNFIHSKKKKTFDFGLCLPHRKITLPKNLPVC